MAFWYCVVTRLSKKCAEFESEREHYKAQCQHVTHKLQVSENQTASVTIDNLHDQVTAISDLKRLVTSRQCFLLHQRYCYPTAIGA